MGTRSGNPLWKNDKSGGTPISAEALNRIEDALDSEDVYISELLEDSDSAINMSLKATIGSKIESYLDANPPAAAPAASTTVKGLVKLAGDLGGTADLPTVPGLAGKADALGPDDNYVTDAEKTKLANLSGTNTGDQTLPTWATIAGKPAVIAQGATQADARTAIGAGTSSLVIGTGAGDAKAGNYAPDLSGLVPKSLVDAKGDLIVATADNTPGRLPVGSTAGHVLTVDPAEATGLKWATSGGGGAAAVPSPPMHQYPVVGRARVGYAPSAGQWRFVESEMAYYYPVYYEAAVTIDGFGCALRGEAAGSTVRLGLFASMDSTPQGWRPGAVVAQTFLSGASAGWKQALLGTPVQLPSAGWYWHALLVTGGRMDVFTVTPIGVQIDSPTIEEAVRDVHTRTVWTSLGAAFVADPDPLGDVTDGPPAVCVRFSAVP